MTEPTEATDIDPDLGVEIEQQPEETTEPEQEPVLTERDRINAIREEELLKEVAEGQGPAKEEPEPEEPQPKTYKVKVDGIEEERSIDDLIIGYQKSVAGDKHLKHAAEERRQLEEERRLIQEERQRLDAERQQRTAPEPEAKPTTTLDELRQARRDALEIGDFDEFDRLDEELSKQRTPPNAAQYDANEIINQATQRAKNQIAYESALSTFVEKNSTIVGDNVLYDIAMKTFDNVCAESATYTEAFAKTENLMKDWIGRITPEQTPVDTAMTDRIDKKKSIQQEPGRLNVKSAPSPAEKEETPSEIIANMRKARGLPS